MTVILMPSASKRPASRGMRDYVSLTSNMTLMETQNNAFAFVNIRGALAADPEWIQSSPLWWMAP